MAIWDDAILKKQENSRIISNSADTHKCPGCAGNLFFDQEIKKLQCNGCGKSYYPEFFEISELLNRSMIEDSSVDEDDEYTKHEIICNACGASVVADKNTISTFCAFCGSPAIISSRLTKAFKPDYLIPFKINKAQAQDIFQKWTENKPFIPKDFTSKATLEKITGLYVPFWMIDADCNIQITGGAHIIEEDNVIRNFEIKRNGKFKMHNVPFDGSKHINDTLMEKIEPFDYSEIVEYTSGYLPGYYAERYDEDIYDMSERIADRFQIYMDEERDSFIAKTQYSSYNIESSNGTSTNYDCKYALFPVWFLNYEYEGIRYRTVINGQTGKIAGEAPYDSKKRKAKQALMVTWGIVKLLLIWTAVFTIVMMYFIFRGGGNLSYATAFKMSLAFFPIMGLYFLIKSGTSSIDFITSVTRFFYKKIEEDVYSIDEAITGMPPARTYINSKDRVLVEEEDTELMPTISIHTPQEDNRRPTSF